MYTGLDTLVMREKRRGHGTAGAHGGSYAYLIIGAIADHPVYNPADSRPIHVQVVWLRTLRAHVNNSTGGLK